MNEWFIIQSFYHG
jgi:hypothetical protein